MIFATLIICGLIYWYFTRFNKTITKNIPIEDNSALLDAHEQIGKLETKLVSLNNDLEYWRKEAVDNDAAFRQEKERNDKVVSQKKSSETRIGQITEHLVPFLEKFKHDPKEVRFLGSPVDLIAFNFEEPSITFIEVKTGNAQESKRQKTIKNIIKAGHVYYEVMRVNPKEVKVKTEENIP